MLLKSKNYISNNHNTNENKSNNDTNGDNSCSSINNNSIKIMIIIEAELIIKAIIITVIYIFVIVNNFLVLYKTKHGRFNLLLSNNMPWCDVIPEYNQIQHVSLRSSPIVLDYVCDFLIVLSEIA